MSQQPPTRIINVLRKPGGKIRPARRAGDRLSPPAPGAEGVVACAKHFPRPRRTPAAIHTWAAVLRPRPRAALRALGAAPLARRSPAGVASVIDRPPETAGNWIPSVRPPFQPASARSAAAPGTSASPWAVVTDALVMEAIRRAVGAGEAAVLALPPGFRPACLMPPTPDAAIEPCTRSPAERADPHGRLEQSLEAARGAHSPLRRCRPRTQASAVSRRSRSGSNRTQERALAMGTGDAEPAAQGGPATGGGRPEP